VVVQILYSKSELRFLKPPLSRPIVLTTGRTKEECEDRETKAELEEGEIDEELEEGEIREEHEEGEIREEHNDSRIKREPESVSPRSHKPLPHAVPHASSTAAHAVPVSTPHRPLSKMYGSALSVRVKPEKTPRRRAFHLAGASRRGYVESVLTP